MAEDQKASPELTAELQLRQKMQLDQFKGALSALKESVETISMENVEEQLKTAFLRDMEELKIPENERGSLWNQAVGKLKQSIDWKEIVRNKIENGVEKGALDNYIGDLENLDAIKTAIKRESPVGVIEKYTSKIEGVFSGIFGSKVGWGSAGTLISKFLIDWADKGMQEIAAKKARKEPVGMTDTWQFSIMMKVGEWFLPPEEKKKRVIEADLREIAKSYKDSGVNIKTPTAEDYEAFYTSTFPHEKDEEKRTAAKAAIATAIESGSDTKPEGPLHAVNAAIQKVEALKGKVQLTMADTQLRDEHADIIKRVLAGTDTIYKFDLKTADVREFITVLRRGGDNGEDLKRFMKEANATPKAAEQKEGESKEPQAEPPEKTEPAADLEKTLKEKIEITLNEMRSVDLSTSRPFTLFFIEDNTVKEAKCSISGTELKIDNLTYKIQAGTGVTPKKIEVKGDTEKGTTYIIANVPVWGDQTAEVKTRTLLAHLENMRKGAKKEVVKTNLNEITFEKA